MGRVNGILDFADYEQGGGAPGVEKKCLHVGDLLLTEAEFQQGEEI